MKKVIIILFVMTITLNGCSNDEDSFSKEALYQTQWGGVLQFIENDESKRCDIHISFETSSTGRYITEGLSKDSEYSAQTALEYKVENKIITLYGGVHNILLGDWWVAKFSDESLLLKREPNTKYESVLNLKRRKL